MKRAVIALACVLFAGPALAQSLGEKTGVNSALGVAPSTADFVKEVAISDMFEIESSKLAASKSTNAEIKKFAQEMIAAHTKTTEQLKSIASTEGFVGELPKEMDQKHAKMVGELKGLSGAKFDRKYVELQVAAHKEAASLFDSYASQGKNAKLKQFAADTAPVIKTHLDHAQMLGKQIPTS